MDEEVLSRAVSMAERLPVFIATADEEGRPHVACAGRMDRAGRWTVAVTEWLCPGTVANVEHRRPISLVVWDPETDVGHQLIGRIEEVESTAVLNGYAPERDPDVPQVQRKLVVRVTEMLAFSRAPHTDQEQ